MKKSLEKQMRSALDVDARSARVNRKSRLAGQLEAAHAPRDITKPITGMAREIDLKHIKPDPDQPRKTLDKETLKQLADSIREHGVLQPISVFWSDEENTYLVITGERRLRAAKLAKLSTIPAIIRPGTYDENQRLAQQLVENIQREGVPAVEEARAIQTLMETFGLSQRAVAKKLGKPQTYVAELQQILRIPDGLLERGKVLPKHSLVQVSREKDEGKQAELIEEALKSKTPFQAVKEARKPKEATERAEQFRARYRAEGFDGSVTVSLAKHPDEVSTEEVVQLLTKVVQTLVSEEAGGR